MSKKVLAAAIELRKQMKWNKVPMKKRSDLVDMVGWVLSATGLNVDLAEWRITCGLKPHKD